MKTMTRALGVDTSNYATSLAVVSIDGKGVVCAKKRFLPVEEGKLGLRQSDAVFHHTAALPQLLGELQEEGALEGVGAVAVSQKPCPADESYMPCFLPGVSFASAFSAAKGVPLICTTHQQGHLAAALFGTGDSSLLRGRSLVFHFSGGTSELLLTEGYEILQVLGNSLDLYAGQAVDRLGVKLGFSFPAGEELSALASGCDEDIAPKVSVKGTNCHFSGLQNQCEQLLERQKSPAYVAKYCLTAIAKTAVCMASAAREQHQGLPLVCAGGVMASGVIREYMQGKMEKVYFVPPQLSSDNAVGVALIAAKEAGYGEYHFGFGAE